MSLARFLDSLRAASDYKGQIEFERELPARRARTGTMPEAVHADLRSALAGQGIGTLYTHQLEAWDAVRRGEDIVVVTSTASGKTLCYNLPVLDALLRDGATRALYLFPTKALAQDQLGKLGQLGLGSRVRAATYDGDTPKSQRSAIRKGAQVVLSNPDMLHVGMLPNYEQWLDFLRRLRFVVVDELHVYRGVFGSHVGNVMRRLFRLCESLQRPPPRVIACSATIGNPAHLARQVVGRECRVVANDGSPSGPRRFVIWNSPLIGQAGERRSANTEATELLAALMSREIRSIAFVRARVVAELLLRYVRGLLGGQSPELSERVESYRGGYTPEERREIERRLFGGELLAVVATTALELGIDVGGLDASVINGYPGSIASLWQQAGRAGRGSSLSATFFVAHNDPLEQHMVRHPELLLDARHEHALVSPDNPHILAQQLRCAVFERPMSDDEADAFSPRARAVLEGLVDGGTLQLQYGRYYCPDHHSPAADVDIRSASGTQYDIVNADGFRRLGTIEEDRAFQMVHPGASYLHRGRQYLVEELDTAARVATAREMQLDYYTEAHTETGLDILVTVEERAAGGGKLCLGGVKVTQQVTGFSRRALFTEEFLDHEALDLPPRTFDTLAVWLSLPAPPEDDEEARLRFGEGLHAVEHALATVVPVLAGCDRTDISSAWYLAHHQTLGPAVFLFDDVPGGVGICESAYRRAEEWIAAALSSLADCPCKEGCPACVLTPWCSYRNEHLDKREAIRILKGLTLSPGGNGYNPEQ
jgi:DEAD/DEAH box helicase domain-containing protein